MIALLGLLILFSSAALPASSQGEPLVVEAEHVFQVIRSGPDSATMVIENIFLKNAGDEPYSGVVWLDLHPAAEGLRYYWHQTDGPRLEGEPGIPSSEPLETESVGDHQRHLLDLSEQNVTLEAGQTLILAVDYHIPAEEDLFTRGFTMDTERVTLHMAEVPGLRPVSQEHLIEPVRDPQRGTWSWRLAPDARGPFEQGQSFSFMWEERQEPLDPLQVEVQSQGQDPVRLQAVVTGGFEPYEVSWDLDGDGECDDAEGQTAELSMEDAGVRHVRACVVDSMGNTASRSFTAQAVLVEGAWDGPSPWLLLVIGLLGGGFLIFALTQGGFLGGGTRRAAPTTSSFGAESKEMLEMRQRVMIAALKELEIAKKKGEVPEAQYTSLKSELKKDTVSVMRELERRRAEKETV
jgi:hypothetical protein